MTTHLRFTDVKRALEALGLRLAKRDSEYRVTFDKGTYKMSYADIESTAYYTTDLDDALVSGARMARNTSFVI